MKRFISVFIILLSCTAFPAQQNVQQETKRTAARVAFAQNNNQIVRFQDAVEQQQALELLNKELANTFSFEDQKKLIVRGIQKGLHPDDMSQDLGRSKKTILTRFIERGDLFFVRYLLDHKANAIETMPKRLADPANEYLLRYASKASIAQLLINYKAPVCLSRFERPFLHDGLQNNKEAACALVYYRGGANPLEEWNDQYALRANLRCEGEKVSDEHVQYCANLIKIGVPPIVRYVSFNQFSSWGRHEALDFYDWIRQKWHPQKNSYAPVDTQYKEKVCRILEKARQEVEDAWCHYSSPGLQEITSMPLPVCRIVAAYVGASLENHIIPESVQTDLDKVDKELADLDKVYHQKVNELEAVAMQEAPQNSGCIVT